MYYSIKKLNDENRNLRQSEQQKCEEVKELENRYVCMYAYMYSISCYVI